jgi:hypothetical protein
MVRKGITKRVERYQHIDHEENFNEIAQEAASPINDDLNFNTGKFCDDQRAFKYL